jgi:hypothetical protein
MTTEGSRFVIGIDLGTTHCALSYIDTTEDGEHPHTHNFAIPQLVMRGQVDSKQLLPSFLYLAHESEGEQKLPWDSNRRFAVGHFARDRGSEAPNRLVSSAKSWLCHPTLDRRGAHLPWGASDDVEKVSPVEATYRYLEHLVEAWDSQFAQSDSSLGLCEQEVVITVPASFDAGARELTAEAAMAAGIEKLTLLEEPQAALYAWLDATQGKWRQLLKVNDVLLVVDIGGGTTDFSAITVADNDGNLELNRVAVGDHILLGGDNMDLALAYTLKAQLKAQGKEIDSWQMNALVHSARQAKEQILTSDVTSAPVVIPGRGAKLLGGAIRTELTRDTVTKVLVDGFFPVVPSAARPQVRARAALTQVGLPYAQDAAITRHLASFLGKQAQAAHGQAGTGFLRPSALLFNGGVMKGHVLSERLVTTLRGWLTESSSGQDELRVLDGADLDHAVSRGAAVYGHARRGKGLRIRGGTARAYYIGIESAAPAVPGMEPPLEALCVAPFGMEEGTHAELPQHELGLVVGEPVRFRFFGSSVRRQDVAGTTMEDWSDEEVSELAPIEVTLPTEGRPSGEVVPIQLRSSVTEVGTLLVEAVPLRPRVENERWRVELSVRGDG